MKKLLPLALITAALVLWAVSGNASADSVYTPASTLRLCNALDPVFPDFQLAGDTACVDNATPGAVTPTTLTSTLPASDVMHDLQVVFTPSSATIAQGSAIPVGEKVGGVRAALTYGLLNAPCNTTLPVDFVLYNVALPNNPGDPRASTNIAYPRAPGSADRFGRWQVGSPAIGANNVTDANADLRADSSTLAIQNYPSILLDAFDPDFLPGNDGPVKPLVPHAVYGALSLFQSEWRIHYIVQFAAGQLTAMPGPFSEMTAAMGQPAVIVTGDPHDGLGAISNITDTCAPSTTATMLLGQTPGGHQRYANPATAATHFTLVYNRSFRDLDQDGFENALDTCPKNVNAGSPKAGTGDADGDGIDNICDATTSPPGDFDEDNDGFENRLDNCPAAANGGSGQLDSEFFGQAELTAFAPLFKYQETSANGSYDDDEDIYRDNDSSGTVSFGDWRLTARGSFSANSVVATGDSDIGVVLRTFSSSEGFLDDRALGEFEVGDWVYYDWDGDFAVSEGDWYTIPDVSGPHVVQTHENVDYGPARDGIGDDCDSGNVTATVNNRPITFTLLPSRANGRYHTQTHTIPRCYGSTDADGDGYCAAQDSADSGACETTSPPSCAVRHNAWGASMPMMQGLDTDNDTWTDALETYLGTEATKACAQSPEHPVSSGGGNDEAPLDNWPMDFIDDNRAATIDVGRFVPRLNKPVNVIGTTRYDLNADGIVNTTDVGKFVFVLNKKCDHPITPSGSVPAGGMGFPTYSSQTQ